MHCQNGDSNVILPIWYQVDAQQMREYSSILADRTAVIATEDIEDLAAQVMADGRITVEIALEALGRPEVDSVGLDEVDHKLL